MQPVCDLRQRQRLLLGKDFEDGFQRAITASLNLPDRLGVRL